MIQRRRQMSEYPKRLLNAEGQECFVNDAKDEATLIALGCRPAEEEKPKPAEEPEKKKKK